MNAKTVQRCAEEYCAEVSESVNSTKNSQVAISKVSSKYCDTIFLSLIAFEQIVPGVHAQ